MQDSTCGTRRKPLAEIPVIDSPCWGSPTSCSLTCLLNLLERSSIILFESDDYLVLNKPPDLRMDGDFPSTVHKLLTYWYPSESILRETQSSPHQNLLETVSRLAKFNDVADNTLRPCHQLDYATSGVLLIGRNRKAAAKACEAFRERTTQKMYLAVCTSHNVRVDSYTILEITEEDVYRHIRCSDQKIADRRKAKRKTFSGYQPPSSIFAKWKHMKVAKSPRDSEMVHHVQEQVGKEALDEMKVLKWSEIKEREEWKQVFEDVASVYNQSIEKEHIENGIRSNDVSPLQLPPVFRVQDENNSDTFFVNAALIQLPDQFAMKMHPESLQHQDPIDPSLDFKFGITKCTVVAHSTLNGTDVTKMKLSPLTGRRHQLRCHMMLVGTPIVGDATYNPNDIHCKVERMCLHAYSLKIPDLIDIQASDPFVLNEKNEIEVKQI